MAEGKIKVLPLDVQAVVRDGIRSIRRSRVPGTTDTGNNVQLLRYATENGLVI
jgi:hypothetical protein